MPGQERRLDIHVDPTTTVAQLKDWSPFLLGRWLIKLVKWAILLGGLCTPTCCRMGTIWELTLQSAGLHAQMLEASWLHVVAGPGSLQVESYDSELSRTCPVRRLRCVFRGRLLSRSLSNGTRCCQNVHITIVIRLCNTIRFRYNLGQGLGH